MLHTLVVDAHPVDDGPVTDDTEKPRLWIPVLGFGGKGADFNEAEAEVGKLVVMVAVLVESACKADRALELQSEDFF